MPRKTVGERPRHNPYQLQCPFASCPRRFRNQSGLTKHLRAYHPEQPGPASGATRRQCSPPVNANLNDAQDMLPIDEPTLPSSPLAGSRFSVKVDQVISDNNARSSPGIQPPHENRSVSPVHTPHGSSRELSPEVPNPEGNEPISKILHPVINGFYISIS